MNRRSYVVLVSGGIVGLAGCTGSGNGNGINPDADILDLFPRPPEEWDQSEIPRFWTPFEIPEIEEGAEAEYTDPDGNVYQFRIARYEDETTAEETDPFTEHVVRATQGPFEFVIFADDAERAAFLLEETRHINEEDIEFN